MVPLQLGPGPGSGHPDRTLPPPTERRAGGADGGPTDSLGEKGEPPTSCDDDDDDDDCFQRLAPPDLGAGVLVAEI